MVFAQCCSGTAFSQSLLDSPHGIGYTYILDVGKTSWALCLCGDRVEGERMSQAKQDMGTGNVRNADASADDPRRCGTGGQPAVQRGRPYLYRPHRGHWCCSVNGCGPVHPHFDAAECFCYAGGCRRCTPHRHCNGAGQPGRCRKDHWQQPDHAADLLGHTDGGVLCRCTGAAAVVRCQ